MVQVFGAYEENGKLYMVMEYLPYSLRNKSVVNKMNILRAISDVARALVRLHSAGQLHRDVKARNVLVTAGFKSAKLCDFGLARALPDPSREEVNPVMTPDIGPPKYRAPEVRRTPSYDVQSDIYGYGVMCKQLLAQLRESTRESVGEEDLAFVERLADDCTNDDKRRRPTAYECLQRCLDQRGRAIQLCSRDTASRRSRYWLDAPMDGGRGNKGEETRNRPTRRRPRIDPIQTRTLLKARNAAMDAGRDARSARKKPPGTPGAERTATIGGERNAGAGLSRQTAAVGTRRAARRREETVKTRKRWNSARGEGEGGAVSRATAAGRRERSVRCVCVVIQHARA